MNSPLSQNHITAAKNSVYECDCCQQEIDRMKALGLDVGELEERCKQLKQFHEKVIEIYGPLVPQETKSRRK